MRPIIAFLLLVASAASAAAQLLECKGLEVTAYIEITNRWFGLPSILLRVSGAVLEFDVDVTNTTHYHAHEKSNAPSRLSLHRMSGELHWQFNTTTEELPNLVDLCDGKITQAQCISRAQRMETSFACSETDLASTCPGWRGGRTRVRDWVFLCAPTAQKF